MPADVERCRKLQAALRKEAQKFTTEESLNALAALTAEAIYSTSTQRSDRAKLIQIFGEMVLDSLIQAEAQGGSAGRA